MHMKHSHLLKIKSAATTLCVAILLCACSNEIGTGDDKGGGKEGEPTTVTLSVGPAAGEQTIPGKALTPNQENAINTLYILAFQPDGAGAYRLKYYATGTPDSGGSGKFNSTLRRSVSGAADTKLLLVANQNPFPQINTGMTYEGVQSVFTSVELRTAPAFADTGIPMFGFAGNSPDTPLTITKGMQLSANLLRAVARVDVGVGTYNEQNGEWNKGSVGFDLTEIYVFKPQNQISLLPLRDNLEYDAGGTPSVTGPSQAGGIGLNFEYAEAITNNTYCKAEIYIPEVDFNGGTVFDGNHEDRTALVIGGTYKGKTNYYRIDFTTAPTNMEGTSLNNVLRNHIYRYSITSVSSPGYNSPENAYSGRPVQLSFTASIIDWVTGADGSPAPDMFVRMNYGGLNGTITEGRMKENGTQKTLTVLKKKNYFITDGKDEKTMLYYNTLRGEAKGNTYNGTHNGGRYTSVNDALNREGPYAKLIIAPENTGGNVAWKTVIDGKTILNAKKACWDYRAQGHSDWRLPRLSELCLIWLNKELINQSKGFTSLGSSGVTYWSATEGRVDGGPNDDDKVYTVNSAGEINLVAKSEMRLVRCVREVK